MTTSQHQSGGTASADGLAVVRKPLLWSHYTPTENALRILGAEGDRQRARAIFRGRASLEAIKNWRRGLIRPPAWARELIAAELRAIERQIVEARTAL